MLFEVTPPSHSSIPSTLRGDGVADDREALQAWIDSCAGRILVPKGTYKIGGTLRIPSGRHLRFHPEAHVVLADGAGTSEAVFLLANANQEAGDRDIVVEGGIWDGNNRNNPRGGSTRGQYTGVSVDFKHVHHLTLRKMQLCDAESYFIRFAWVEDFVCEDLHFTTSAPRPNQDGLHVAGHCHRGVIRNIHATGPNATKDDLVALVADDELARPQNLGLCRGPISGMEIANLSADDCHSFVRLASVDHPIEDVTVEGVRGGCEACAINMDALRYCAMPIFQPEDPRYAAGAGMCRRVRLGNFHVHRSKAHLNNPLILLETLMEDFEIRNFQRDTAQDVAPEIPTLRMAHVTVKELGIQGLRHEEAIHLRDTLPACAIQPGDRPENLLLQGSLAPADALVSHAASFSRILVP